QNQKGSAETESFPRTASKPTSPSGEGFEADQNHAGEALLLRPRRFGRPCSSFSDVNLSGRKWVAAQNQKGSAETESFPRTASKSTSPLCGGLRSRPEPCGRGTTPRYSPKAARSFAETSPVSGSMIMNQICQGISSSDNESVRA